MVKLVGTVWLWISADTSSFDSILELSMPLIQSISIIYPPLLSSFMCIIHSQIPLHPIREAANRKTHPIIFFSSMAWPMDLDQSMYLLDLCISSSFVQDLW